MTIFVAANNVSDKIKDRADYLCKGIEDEIPINTAIDEASDHGEEVKLSGGGFIKDDPIIPKSNVALRGSGPGSTTIKQPRRNNKNIIQTLDFDNLTGTNSKGGVKGFEISDLRIDGNKNFNNAGRGIAIYGNRFRLNNIEVTETPDEGIYSEWATSGSVKNMDTALEAFLSRVKVGPCDNDGIRWRGPHDSHGTDIIAFGCDWGIDFERLSSTYSGAGTGLSGVHCYGNSKGGIRDDAGNLTGTDVEVEGHLDAGQIGILFLRNSVKLFNLHGAKNDTAMQIGDATHRVKNLRLEAQFGIRREKTGINFATKGTIHRTTELDWFGRN